MDCPSTPIESNKIPWSTEWNADRSVKGTVQCWWLSKASIIFFSTHNAAVVVIWLDLKCWLLRLQKQRGLLRSRRFCELQYEVNKLQSKWRMWRQRWQKSRIPFTQREKRWEMLRDNEAVHYRQHMRTRITDVWMKHWQDPTDTKSYVKEGRERMTSWLLSAISLWIAIHDHCSISHRPQPLPWPHYLFFTILITTAISSNSCHVISRRQLHIIVLLY